MYVFLPQNMCFCLKTHVFGLASFANIKIQFWRDNFDIHVIFGKFRVSNFAKIGKSEYSTFCMAIDTGPISYWETFDKTSACISANEFLVFFAWNAAMVYKDERWTRNEINLKKLVITKHWNIILNFLFSQKIFKEK